MTRSIEQIVVRLLPLGFVLACQSDTTMPTAAPVAVGDVLAVDAEDVVATVAVVPDSFMVFNGEQFRLTAEPRNAAGQLLSTAVRWTITNTALVRLVGSHLPVMTFKSTRIGTTTITATSESQSGRAKVVVRGLGSARLVLTPAQATVEAGATAQFVATTLTKLGEPAFANVTWSATGGTISPSGVLSAGDVAGTYQVIAKSRFAADTSIVTITDGGTPPPEPVVELVLVPDAVELTAGEVVRFQTYGLTGAGDSVGVAVSYTATGGTIAGDGRYTAGQAPGTFQVVAESGELSATAEVVIAAAGIARVTLLPTVAASRGGETIRFIAAAWSTAGDSVPSEPVSYATTCGTVSGTGVFTAPKGQSGSCMVTASARGKSATTAVFLLSPTRTQGVPFGATDLWSTATTTRASGAAPLALSHDYIPPHEMVSHIEAARSRGVRLVLPMTGGAHSRYKTNGVFDIAKWEAAMDAYATPAIKAAIAAGVSDGTIVGNSVMDEPQQSGTDSKAWGPEGTMTKQRVDGLCAYVKSIFPTLPAGVHHDHAIFEPSRSYRVCDFIIDQYSARKGNITSWRDAGLAMAARDGHEVIFSLNVLNGAAQDRTGAWDCPGTGGTGTYAPNCRLLPQQVRDWGKILGRAGCALLSWKFDNTFMNKVENQAALSEVAIELAGLPRRPCTRR